MPPSLRLNRLRYRSWHRGCKETDLILGRFADTQLARLDEASLARYERLLEEEDADIWQWLIGKAPAPAEYAGLLESMKKSGTGNQEF